MPPRKSTGMNTATSDIVIETNREADFFRSEDRRLVPVLSHFHVPDDVLEHDDGIIDDKTDGQRQGHQRQRVQAVVQADTSRRKFR